MSNPGFAGGVGGERARAYNWDLAMMEPRPPAGSGQVAEPLVGVRGKAESILSIFIRKWGQINLNDS